MAEIPILGVPSTFKVPGQFAEIIFSQGPSSAAAAAREVIMCMPMLASGAAWIANTVYRVRNEQEAIDGAGAGSFLHRAIRFFLKSNRTAKLWALPYAATSGMGIVSATGTVTVATAPTGTGVFTVTVAGVKNTAGVDSSQDVTAVAAAMVAVINAKEWLPVTAANAAGVITMTAKTAGASSGDGTTGIIRFRSEITSGIATTVADSGAALGLGTGVAGVDGAVTEATGLTAALVQIEAARYYYVGVSVWTAAELTLAQTHVSTKSEPIRGLRSKIVGGYPGSLATGQTLAISRNYERLQIVWQPNSEHDPAELAGNMLGLFQKYEELDSAFNFNGYSASDFLLLPAFDEGDWPDVNDQNDAITDGLTPIASNNAGAYFVMSITTRTKDSGGTLDDFRVAQSHRVSVADDFTDTLLLRHALNYSGKKLKSDKLLSNGKVDNNQRLFPGVVTPRQYKPSVGKLLDEFSLAAKIQEVETSKEGLRVVRDPQNGGRLEIGLDLHVIDLFDQATFRIAEVSTG